MTTLAIHRPRGYVKLTGRVTVDASGDQAVSPLGSAWGRVVAIGFDADTLATGTDVTFTDHDSGGTLFTITNTGVADLHYKPTAVVRDSKLAAISASTSAIDVNRDIYVAGQVDYVVAQGGVSTSGFVYMIVDENRSPEA